MLKLQRFILLLRHYVCNETVINLKMITMKKILTMLLLMVSTAFAASAQETQVKVKKTTTTGQKVHNTFSKHKRYKGVKVKAKKGDKKVVGEVNAKTGEAEIKHN